MLCPNETTTGETFYCNVRSYLQGCSAFTYVVNFGDGQTRKFSSLEQIIKVPKLYAQSGTYSISIKIVGSTDYVYQTVKVTGGIY